MNNTKAYRTRHEFHKPATKLPLAEDFIIGLDAGYSGMKVWYENGYFCFPSYARKITGIETLNLFDDKDILYRDGDTGEVYMIGYTAQEMAAPGDTNDTNAESSGRKRYWNTKFQILCKAAIGICLLSRAKDDERPVFLETGLPASYVKGDSQSMINALSKKMNFSLKIGKQPWADIKTIINKEKIHIMPQPAGALYSSLISSNGKYANNAKQTLYGKVLVGDFGSGTADFYGFRNRQISCCESLTNIGGGEIIKRVCDMILSEYGEDIREQALQHNLETGYITCFNEETMQQEDKPINDFVKKASDEVFAEAMERSKSATNSFRDYEKLIIAGGTGEAWMPKIREYLSGMKSLEIIPANITDVSIPLFYSVARGYYLYRYTLTRH